MCFDKTIEIGGQTVGDKNRCFVIAEAGSNHNKDMTTAKRLIDAAVTAKVDAVKFQSFTAGKIAADTLHPVAQLGDRFGAYGKTLHSFYKNSELPKGWIRDLFDYAREKGICAMSTPFDEQAVDDLVELGMQAIKIASFELVHLPLLRHAAQTGLPLILSTGMATLGEIEEALDAVAAAGGTNVALLHCNIEYPPAMCDIELRAMDTMRSAFHVPVGFSDHTSGIHIPVAAVAMGACIIEKHFTLAKDDRGPDHGFALEPDELSEMVASIRDVEQARGVGRKGRVAAEETHAVRGRRSVFAARDIPAHTIIELDMLAVLRPGVGLHPRHLGTLVGKKTTRMVRAHEPMAWNLVCETDS